MVFSSILFLIFTLQLFHFSKSTTVVVDGVSEWKNPHLQAGDSVIFQHKYHYSLYIFKNQEAFSLCNFSQATILTKPNSTIYTWHTSRAGFFFFSFFNGSNQPCVEGSKLAVKVTLPPPHHQASALSPSPSSGGFVASSSAFSADSRRFAEPCTGGAGAGGHPGYQQQSCGASANRRS